MDSPFGVIVVTHNSAEVIGACLDALAGLSVVVVDNASRDGTTDRVRERPWVRLMVNTENRGFAAAVNQGIARLDTDCILILNPDVAVQCGLRELGEACQKSGVAAGKLVDVSGQAQKGFTIRRFPTPGTLILEILGLNRLWPGNPVNRRYRYLDRDLDMPGQVEQPAGAFLAVRRDVWQKAGGLDERFYPVWFEDVDFCRRVWDLGFRPQYVPEAAGCHLGGHSVGHIPERLSRLYWYGNLLGYASKHFCWFSYGAVSVAVVLGSVPRMLAGVVVQGSLEPAAAYCRVIRLAVSRLFSAGRGECGEFFRPRQGG